MKQNGHKRMTQQQIPNVVPGNHPRNGPKMAERAMKWPWEEWEEEYKTRRNPDGTWFYQTRCEFAKAKGLDRKPSDLVEFMKATAPMATANHTYIRDWDRERGTPRPRREMMGLAKRDSELDAIQDALRDSLYTAEKLQAWMDRVEEIRYELDQHFQGRLLRDNRTYPPELERTTDGLVKRTKQEEDEQFRYTDYFELTHKALNTFNLLRQQHREEVEGTARVALIAAQIAEKRALQPGTQQQQLTDGTGKPIEMQQNDQGFWEWVKLFGEGTQRVVENFQFEDEDRFKEEQEPMMEVKPTANKQQEQDEEVVPKHESDEPSSLRKDE